MLAQEAGESGGMNISQLENVAINVVDTICSIVARPVELILRPWHGTRYFAVPVVFLSTMLMLFLPVMSAVTTSVGQMIPGLGVRPPEGMFGIGAFSEVYFLLSFIHGIRLWRRMLDMSKEMHSEYEGPPRPFFQLLPKSESFWFTRVILEPLVVLIAATILGRFLIFQSDLTTYLQVAAFALAMSQFISWYRSWLYLRALMDAKFAGPIVAGMVENRATQEDLAKIHMASFPKNLAPDIREAAVSHIARAFAPEAQTKPSTPAQ